MHAGPSAGLRELGGAQMEDRKGPITTEGEEEGPGGRQGSVRVQDGLERRALVLLK